MTALYYIHMYIFTALLIVLLHLLLIFIFQLFHRNHSCYFYIFTTSVGTSLYYNYFYRKKSSQKIITTNVLKKFAKFTYKNELTINLCTKYSATTIKKKS